MTTPEDDSRERPGPHDPDLPLLSEAEEREVTALLAGLAERGPVATPPEVVARLDEVLDGLVAERRAGPAGPPLVRSEERDRRRRWPRLLLAAAAVVVGGYAVNGVVHGTGVGSGGSGSASSAGSAGGQDDVGRQEKRSAADSSGSGPAGSSGSGHASGSTMALVPTVRRDHLAGDVRRVVRMFHGRAFVQPTETPSPSSGQPEASGTCPVPRLLDGQRFYEVRYQRAPAGLVVGAPEQGSVDVTVYACSDGGVLLTRSVPTP
jgi:hypothetical protein